MLSATIDAVRPNFVSWKRWTGNRGRFRRLVGSFSFYLHLATTFRVHRANVLIVNNDVIVMPHSILIQRHTTTSVGQMRLMRLTKLTHPSFLLSNDPSQRPQFTKLFQLSRVREKNGCLFSNNYPERYLRVLSKSKSFQFINNKVYNIIVWNSRQNVKTTCFHIITLIPVCTMTAYTTHVVERRRNFVLTTHDNNQRSHIFRARLQHIRQNYMAMLSNMHRQK